MTQINLDPGLLKLVNKKCENHHFYSKLNLMNHTKRVEKVLYDFIKEDYVIIHKDNLGDLINDAVPKIKNGN